MRIALTHNLRREEGVAESGFASAETVASLTESIARLEHEVVPVEVSESIGATIAALRAADPELVFNIAEGRSGPWRQAVYAAVFADLELPFTGSDAQAIGIALDKNLTKLVMRQHGVATPEWQHVTHPDGLRLDDLPLPAMVKPNLEGYSRGITEESIVTTADEAVTRVTHLLAQYPDGVLVERFIPGRDIVVPYLEAADRHGGALDLAELVFAQPADGQMARTIIDYDLKDALSRGAGGAVPRIPADVPAGVVEQARAMTRVAVHAVGCRDFARVDFRLDDTGTLYALEVNSLPTLQAGGSMHRAAALAGLDPVDGHIAAIIASAVGRTLVLR